MSIEDKIPAPRITHPNKAALKRKPTIRVWLSGAAAAAVVAALGLGYFFGQWSEPAVIVAQIPIAEQPVLPKDTVIATPHETATPPEPIKAVSPQKTVVAELPEPRVEPEPIATIEPVAIEHEMLIEIEIVTPTIEIPVERIAAVTVQPIEEYDEIEPSSERIGYGKDVVDNFRNLPQKLAKMGQESVSNLRRKDDRIGYGTDVIETLRNLPHTFARSDSEHYKPFRKQNKKLEIEI